MTKKRYDNLPDEILDKACSLTHLGIFEYAWKKEEIEKILQVLMEKGIPVLGGDVYSVNNGRISSTYDSWFINNDGSLHLVEESIEKSLSYISEYECRNGNEFVYVLVF